MSRALSTTQQDIDRSFEKAIYDVLLANGYIADRAAYETDRAGYNTAMAAIKTSKGFCVELFSSSPPQDKTALGVPRIIITGRGFSQGSVGRDFGDQFELNEESGKYSKYNQGNPLSDYRLTIELISNSTPQDRLLEAVRQAALPNLTYLPKYNDPDVVYLITYLFTASVPEMTHGLTQKIYTYRVADVAEAELNLVSTNISPIKEIEVINDTDGTQIVKVTSPP